MPRQLSEMTLEELWKLFPISLVPHDDQWEVTAREEMVSLDGLFPEGGLRISHIGSTAIPGICAKPIMDLLVEVPDEITFDEVKTRMESAGYICMSRSGQRMSFNKGYTPQGYAEKVFHIHFRRPGDNDEILFRDYLIAHPLKAREYETLKKSLLPRYRNDRDAYTGAKSEFVRSILRAAGLPDKKS